MNVAVLVEAIQSLLGQLAPRQPFAMVRTQMLAAATPADRAAALNAGISSASAWRVELLTLTSAGRGPVPPIRTRIATESRTAVDVNPLVGVRASPVECAYRAFAEGAVTEPWVLLAIWVKEGLATPVTSVMAATSEADARALWRSTYYYQNMGLDHFIHYTPSASGDNVIGSNGADHDVAFRTRIREQVNAGRLARDISADINSEIVVTPAGAGSFNVAPRQRFYTLSLLLADAFFREYAAAVAADARIGANPDIRLVYARWNLGGGRFNTFVTSAESHRVEPRYHLGGGVYPTIAQWAFEREALAHEWEQPRRNAIRFGYYAEVYRLIYEGFVP